MRQRGQHGDVRFHVTEREEGVSVGGGMAAGKASWRPANGLGLQDRSALGAPRKGEKSFQPAASHLCLSSALKSPSTPVRQQTRH